MIQIGSYNETVTIERLERAIVVISQIILQEGGAVYTPILERLELELATMRAHEDVMSRAAKYIERAKGQAAANAID